MSFRSGWQHLVLSACRLVEHQDQLDSFSVENSRDVSHCSHFFSAVLDKVRVTGGEGGALSGPKLLFEFLTRVMQRDLELWWRQYRRREDAVVHPIIYYLLGGESRLIASIQATVLKLYRALLPTDRDLTAVRRLVALCALLIAHRDSQVKQSYMFNGSKLELASQVYSALNCLEEQQLGLELALLQVSS